MYRLIVVGADADALDGLAGGLAAGIVGAWGADEGAVLVARGVLESALRLGGDAVGEVLRAAHLEDSGALGGAEIAGDALDLDGLFIGEAAVWLGVLVVGRVGEGLAEPLLVDGEGHGGGGRKGGGDHGEAESCAEHVCFSGCFGMYRYSVTEIEIQKRPKDCHVTGKKVKNVNY